MQKTIQEFLKNWKKINIKQKRKDIIQKDVKKNKSYKIKFSKSLQNKST